MANVTWPTVTYPADPVPQVTLTAEFLLPKSGGRPMSDAPRDGQWLLVSSDGIPIIVRWVEDEAGWRDYHNFDRVVPDYMIATMGEIADKFITT